MLPGHTFLPVDLANNNLPWRTGPPRPLQNWLISDPLYEFYPFLVNAVETLRQHATWPLWNPHIFLGHPVVADPLMQPFYPAFAALGLAFGAARGFAVGLWLHVIAAAVFTYVYLRAIRRSIPAAVLGAFTYALGGYLVTWFEFPHRVATLTWLPAVLWLYELALRRQRWRYVAGAGTCLGLAVLGGQLQFSVTFIVFLALYAFGRAVERILGARSAPAWPVVAAAATIGLGVLLSAIQTIPLAEFLPRTHRVLATGMYDPLPLRQLITLIVPNFYGNPATIGPYWGAYNFSEDVIYAGLPALILAGAAVLTIRRFFVVYFFSLTVALVYFAAGGPGIALIKGLPVLAYVSLHRAVFLLPLLVAYLAATALDVRRLPSGSVLLVTICITTFTIRSTYLERDQVQQHWPQLQAWFILSAALAILTVLVLLARNRPRHRLTLDWALVGLVFADLFLFGHRYNPVGSVAQLMPATPGIAALREDADTGRVVAQQLDGQVNFGPNVMSIFGLSEPGGYSSLHSARLSELVEAADSDVEIGWMQVNPNILAFSTPPRRLLDLLGVTHTVSPAPRSDLGVRAVIDRAMCPNTTPPITPEQPVKGSFRVADVAINRIDLRFRRRPDQTAPGTLSVRMWEDANRQRQVLEATVNTADLKDTEPVTFYFEPERGAPGKTYAWEVAAPEAPAGQIRLCADASGQPAISVYGADWAELQAGNVYVYERLAGQPRVYVVYGAEHIPEDGPAAGRLLAESFDLRNSAVTAAAVNLPTTPRLPSTPAEITSYSDTVVRIHATAEEPGLLVLSDHIYPGWQAYVDGERAPVIRVNYLMRGVGLSPGEHEVVFRFAPQSLKLGLAFMLAGLIGTATLIAIDGHIRWPQPRTRAGEDRVVPNLREDE